LLLKSHKETTNRELPVRWGRRNAIAVSEAQTVEGHADACERTRTLKFPTFPKLEPSTDTATLPDETLHARVVDETAGTHRTASDVSEARALDATLSVSREILPLSDDKRHVTLLSLVQNEPAQAVAMNRADGDDAILANAKPERIACALPVVGTQAADILVATGSG
jgi:hypothetical protein